MSTIEGPKFTYSPDAFAQFNSPRPSKQPPDPGTHGSYFQTTPFRMPDLLTPQDIAGMCQLSLQGAFELIRLKLPKYAVVKIRNKIRVHSWAMAHFLKMAEVCPGCGREWNLEVPRGRRDPKA